MRGRQAAKASLGVTKIGSISAHIIKRVMVYCVHICVRVPVPVCVHASAFFCRLSV